MTIVIFNAIKEVQKALKNLTQGRSIETILRMVNAYKWSTDLDSLTKSDVDLISFIASS